MRIPKVVVIGGGIAGLACAYRLFELKKERNIRFDIILLEGSDRLGGTIATEEKDGFLLEKGADSFISDTPWALDLAKRLGIDSQIIGTREGFRKSFVARGDKLIPLPEGFYLIAPLDFKSFLRSPLFSWPGKFRMGLEPFIPKREEEGDESIGSFIVRRFGQEALDRVGQAMLAGIYTGDPYDLSLQATMPRFLEFEQTYGSVIRGLQSEMTKRKKEFSGASGPRYSLFLSFKNGMETLPRALSSELPSEIIRLGSKVKTLLYDQIQHEWKIETENGEVYDADAVCLSAPAWKTSELLSNFESQISQKLSRISYESIATINFAFKKNDIQHPLDGFGFVVPRIEKRSLVACSFSSVKFDNRAPENHVLLRAFVGGVFGKDFYEMENQDLLQIVMKDLTELLGIQKGPLFSMLTRYPRAMVQYQIGHTKLVSEIKADLERMNGLFLTGSAYSGVGIPDCIRDAEFQAGRVVDTILLPAKTNGGVSYGAVERR